jgi:L-galactose dehydrogenase
MEYRKLGHTGMEVSVLSFGASSLGGVFHQVNLHDCMETVGAALEGGINFIDVAPAYGETLAEFNLGKALNGVSRDRYYLATKIGAYSEARGDYDYSAERTERSLHESLQRLGVDTQRLPPRSSARHDPKHPGQHRFRPAANGRGSAFRDTRTLKTDPQF